MRHVAERYIAKSDPFIVMVSTPNKPDGLFAKIEKEPFETCIYKRLCSSTTQLIIEHRYVIVVYLSIQNNLQKFFKL
jgi:hypothetical protein